jgi:DNA invertase Pin-like site-specific DNA recombinase
MGLTPARRWARRWRTWLVVFAELERDFIRSRTREALVVRRDRGVVLGRPGSTPDDVVARVVREGKEGKTAYAFPRLEQGRCADCAGCTPGRKLRSARC